MVTPAVGPTFNAYTLPIRNGHTVNVTAPGTVTVEQVCHREWWYSEFNGAVNTVNDGHLAGDMDIQNRGVLLHCWHHLP